MDLNQSHASVATLSAVHLIENNNAGSNIQSKSIRSLDGKNQRQSIKSAESYGHIKEHLHPLEGDNGDDTDCNIDCIDLGTEDEYASSVYTARSISPTSR